MTMCHHLLLLPHDPFAAAWAAMQGLISRGAYTAWVQRHVVQAQYVKVSSRCCCSALSLQL